MTIEVLDNYLPEREYSMIHDCVMGYKDAGDIQNSFTWIFDNKISIEPCPDNHFQLIHLMFMEYNILSPYFDLMRPIIKKEGMVALSRIKANSIIRTETLKVFENSFHTDFEPETAKRMQTAIYYVNSNDGYTLFEDGTKVESVANRLVRFPANIKHTGTTCTNAHRRVLINFNWF
tara:strand:+ start:206 stop:733 length:528 start_codon:yes stop_codon:yes gene_type:complete